MIEGFWLVWLAGRVNTYIGFCLFPLAYQDNLYPVLHWGSYLGWRILGRSVGNALWLGVMKLWDCILHLLAVL